MVSQLIPFFFFCCFSTVFSAENDDDLMQINKLRRFLLKSRRYSRNARPVVKHSTVTNVTFVAFVRRLIDIDIMSGKFSVFSTLQLTWHDEHLEWNPEEYGGLDEINFGYWEIWKPDIRSVDSIEPSSSYRLVGKEPIVVTSNGMVSWWPRAILVGGCKIDLKDFPSDSQECQIYIASWSYSINEVNLTKSDDYDGFIYGPFQPNPEWDEVSVQATRSEYEDERFGTWPTIDIAWTFKRRDQIYRYKTGLIYVSASILSLASFLSPIGSIRRYLFASLAIATLFFLLFSLALQLGPISLHVPFAVKCIVLNLVTVSFSLIVTTFIRIIIGRMASSENLFLPRLIVNVIDNPLVRTILFINTSSILPSVTDHTMKEGFAIFGHDSVLEQEWILLSQFVDRICFFFFIATTIIYHC